VTDRFAEQASLIAERQDRRADELAEQVRRFVEVDGNERAIDVGTGAGALAFALAPLVREVVGVDRVPELLAEARKRAPENVTFVEEDATRLSFPAGSFDVAATARTLHHVPRPELLVAELARVVRPGGHVLVIDQIAPADPLAALELDRFERARDPAHTRLLPDVDMRHLFEANGFVLRRSRVEREKRELEPYLDVAGCEGEAREHARALAPGGPGRYLADVGWYWWRKPGVG
jgi:ubiquinone/menaquinone biosynthesis C-methylase UbiE